MNTSEIVNNLHQGQPIDPVHPGPDQMMKSKYPVIESNKYTQPLNSLNFGAKQIACNIPSGGVVKQIFLNGRFAGSVTAALVANPGHAMIDSVEYKIGNSTLYTIQDIDIWNINCTQLRTQEAIAEAWLLAGGDAAAVTATGREFSIAIPTPYSRFMLMSRQYGIDTTVFPTPLYLSVSLKTQDKVYTADTSITSLATASFHIIQSEYLDRSNRLVPSDNKFLSLPTRYFQSYTSKAFTPSSASEQQSVDFLSFRSGNLIGMIIQAVDSANFNGTQPFKYNSIKDLDVKFNGVSVYKSLGTDYKIQQLRNAVGSYSYHTGYSQRNYRVEPCFVPFHWGQSGHNFNYGLSLNGQTLQATFTIENSTNAQVLRVLYVYDALILYNGVLQDLVV
jgi:hypothetical protein